MPAILTILGAPIPGGSGGYYNSGPQTVHVCITNAGDASDTVRVEVLGKGPLTGHDPSVFFPLAATTIPNFPPGFTPVPLGVDFTLTTGFSQCAVRYKAQCSTVGGSGSSSSAETPIRTVTVSL